MPVELTLAQRIWLGGPGTKLSGYLNSSWRLQPAGPLVACGTGSQSRYDIVKSCGAVGSRIHMNFAAQPALLPAFFQPEESPSGRADPWTAGR